MFVWDESDLLDLSIDGSLKGAVEAFGFRSQFGCVGDFGFDGYLELVGGIPWQSEAFAVVGDDFDSHGGGSFLLMGEYRKTAMPRDRDHGGSSKDDRQVSSCVWYI